ncbi:MAG: helix-turn-helix domain-containing protein [Bacilli bacterium]
MNNNYLRRIKSLREEKNITQEQISKILNVSQRTYSYYENGRDIPIEILIKLADFYKVSIDYLLNRTDKKEIYK